MGGNSFFHNAPSIPQQNTFGNAYSLRYALLKKEFFHRIQKQPRRFARIPSSAKRRLHSLLGDNRRRHTSLLDLPGSSTSLPAQKTCRSFSERQVEKQRCVSASAELGDERLALAFGMFATHVMAFMYFEVVSPLHVRDKKLFIVIY